MNDPILHLGLDIATKRDTCAVVGLVHDYDKDIFYQYGHKIWHPPVNIAEDVEPWLFEILEKERVAHLLYDPYQAVTTIQRLEAAGYGAKLVEVNQLTEMTRAANALHSVCTEGRIVMYSDPEVKAQFSWASAQHTERGWRIVKSKQSRQIDVVVALAMSLLGATGEIGYAMHQSYEPDIHSRSAMDLL